MPWNKRYRLWSYIRSSLWIVPFISLLLYLVAIRVAGIVAARVEWEPWWPWTVEGAQLALQAIVTMTLTFIVFTFGSLLVAIQVAGGQLTPRIVAATLLGNNAIRYTVGLFIFALLFANGTLARLGKVAQGEVMLVAGLLGLGALSAFLFLIDYAARLLQPLSIVWRVGEQGLAVIRKMYPDPLGERTLFSDSNRQRLQSERTILHRGRSGIVLAVNLKGLVAEARKCGSMIEVVPRVGEFVGADEPLFRICGGTPIDERRIRGLIAFGPERSMEQDPTFAFRIIIDIAIKGLSKAINDPTTAVLAIDQLHRLLRAVGTRELRDEVIRDHAGVPRVIFQTPNWEDFVHLTFSEIRLYGAENFQIARRLRAMLNNLIEALPERRRDLLVRERELLDRAIQKLYVFPEDVAVAQAADPQGLGSSSSRN